MHARGTVTVETRAMKQQVQTKRLHLHLPQLTYDHEIAEALRNCMYRTSLGRTHSKRSEMHQGVSRTLL